MDAVRGLAMMLLAGAVSASAEPFRVVSLNAAGVPLVHAKLDRRLAAIAEGLKGRTNAIVGLQELWFDRHSSRLARESGYPHAYRAERDTWTGDGLLVLSRFPVTARHARPFRARVREWFIWPVDLEGIARKGAVMSRLALPDGEVDFYDAHLIASYDHAGYESLRLIQLLELSDMVRELSPGRPVIVTGDLNTGTGEPGYSIFLELTGLTDPCLKDGVEFCGETGRKGRIDYILHSGGETTKAALAFEGTIDGKPGSPRYSDHRGVEAEFPGLPAPLARVEGTPRFRAALARLKKLIEVERDHPRWGRAVETALARIDALSSAGAAVAAK